MDPAKDGTGMDWDVLLLDCSLATMVATDGDAYGAVEIGAIAWKDGLIAYVGEQSALPSPPDRLAAA